MSLIFSKKNGICLDNSKVSRPEMKKVFAAIYEKVEQGPGQADAISVLAS